MVLVIFFFPVPPLLRVIGFFNGLLTPDPWDLINFLNELFLSYFNITSSNPGSIYGYYPFSVTTASGVITITPFWG